MAIATMSDGPAIGMQIDLSDDWTVVDPSNPEEVELYAREIVSSVPFPGIDDKVSVEDVARRVLGQIESAGVPIMIGRMTTQAEDGVVLASVTVVLDESGTTYDALAPDLVRPIGREVDDRRAVSWHAHNQVDVRDHPDLSAEFLATTYVVEIDELASMVFTFSTPNVALKDDMRAYFAQLMDSVTIDVPSPQELLAET